MAKKTYHELIRLPTFEDRLRYLLIGGTVGRDTFGFDRYLNQMFYRDDSWKRIRRDVILRDSYGSDVMDLGCKDRPIAGFVYVHHIAPITKDDILAHSECLLDPDNLVCCSKATHDMIHYGLEADVKPPFVERRPNDTCPWKN